MSWHAAFVRLLLLRVVPDPVYVVGLFEGFHLKVWNLWGFRWSVSWGVSNFRFHTGCINVLEGSRGKPAKNDSVKYLVLLFLPRRKGGVLRLVKAVVKQRLTLRA